MSDSLRPHGLYSPWNSPGQNSGVGSLSLLQEIFPTQGPNPGLPHCRWIVYQLSYKGSFVKDTCLNQIYVATIFSMKSESEIVSHSVMSDPMDCNPPGSTVHEIL